VYEMTPSGLEDLRSWPRDSEPDYSVCYEVLLRVFCLWVLPTDRPHRVISLVPS